MNFKSVILLLLLHIPIFSNDNLWTLSFDLGVPELTGLRVEKHSSYGTYWGFQPGLLVTLPAHIWGPDEPWAFTPAFFWGKDVRGKGVATLAAEVHISHPMSWNRYDKGGAFLISPRLGLSVKSGKLLFRLYGGVSFVTFKTVGWPRGYDFFPCILIEAGSILGKKRWDQFHKNINNNYRDKTVYVRELDNDSSKMEQREIRDPSVRDTDEKLQDRFHSLTTDPLTSILNRNLSITYSYRLSEHIAIGLNPQLGFSDYSTKFGAAAMCDFYFRKTFYGLFIPIFIGYIPARLSAEMKNGTTSSKTSDIIYAFGTGTGVGYRWCFKNGFTITPGAGISYISFRTEPTDEFKDTLQHDFGESYQEFRDALPAIMFGLGLSLGWSF